MTMQIGIIGCGDIVKAYFNGAKNCPNLEVKSCTDINMDVARAKAAEFGSTAVEVDELLADPDIQLVLNLTTPLAHLEVNSQILNAGKHVYSEKPLGIDLDEAKKIIDLAKQKNLRIGCAPDTFLGAGLQTTRKLIDDGKIGKPVAATAVFANHGHEHWHPNPAFHYQTGGGPMLDMGPYYITAMLQMFGPAKRVAAITNKFTDQRIASGEKTNGLKIDVNTITHLTGTIEFHSGAIATVITSFDMWAHNLPRLEFHGETGSIQAPDPNCFNGPVLLTNERDGGWQEAELSHPENARMYGVADMVAAIENNRPHRASGDQAYHALEIMTAFNKSSQTGQHVMIQSKPDRPAALPLGLAEWQPE